MKVSGVLRVPGDKSISHRSLMFAALANGASRITGILQSADVHSTAGVLRALGANIPELSNDFVVQGSGSAALRQPDGDLDCGNSGTTTRLMAGIVSGLPLRATFVGDASLSKRPMRRVAKPLEAMGAKFELPAHGGLPMTIQGGALHDIEWKSEIASAQVKSAVLLAGLVSGRRVSYEEPLHTRDHTERMLSARGVTIGHAARSAPGHAAREARASAVLEPNQTLDPLDTDVPGDPSSAAFFAGLAAIADGGELLLDNVCANPGRIGFFNTIIGMGVRVTVVGSSVKGGEPVVSYAVSPGALRAATIGEADVPAMVDELPLLACIATRAEGETRITGANELRVKESDRIAAVVSNLRAIGAYAEELPDGMVIRGSDKPLRGRIVTHGDHRLAMAFGVLGAARDNDIEIDDRDCVAVSYPGFWNDLARVASQ